MRRKNCWSMAECKSILDRMNLIKMTVSSVFFGRIMIDKNICFVIGGNMTMIKKHGFLMVNCFVKGGIKKVRQFIKNGMIQDLVNVSKASELKKVNFIKF